MSTLISLGAIAVEEDDWSEAEVDFRQALAVAQRLADQDRIAELQGLLAFVAEEQGRTA